MDKRKVVVEKIQNNRHKSALDFRKSLEDESLEAIHPFSEPKITSGANVCEKWRH